MVSKKEFTNEQMDVIAERAGKAALREFFKELGYDINKPESMIELQNDWRYLRDERQNTEKVKQNIEKTFWAVLPMVALGALSWALIVFSSGLRSAALRWLAAP